MSGERLQNHWSSGFFSTDHAVPSGFDSILHLAMVVLHLPASKSGALTRFEHKNVPSVQGIDPR